MSWSPPLCHFSVISDSLVCQKLKLVKRDSALRDGRATVEHLAPGNYRLAGDIGEMQFTVPTSGEIRFDPPRYDAMLLKNIKPGGQIEALGLRNNDLLIAIDGQPIMAALSAGASLYNYAQEKPNATWTIQRGGATLELAIDGAALQRIWREGEDGEKERIWTFAAYR